MYFTKEDLKKIEEYLISKSVKDSDFVDAEVLDKQDYVTIVHNKDNYKLRLIDLIQIIKDLEIDSLYNSYYEIDANDNTFEEVLRKVPVTKRLSGLILLVKKGDGSWEIWFFKGMPNQWLQMDSWELLKDTSQSNFGPYEGLPHNPKIGTSYYCFNRKSEENSEMGIVLFYKGNGVWTDALGKIII